MSLGMGNYRQILVSISRYLSITTHTPPKNTGVVTLIRALVATPDDSIINQKITKILY